MVYAGLASQARVGITWHMQGRHRKAVQASYGICRAGITRQGRHNMAGQAPHSRMGIT